MQSIKHKIIQCLMIALLIAAVPLSATPVSAASQCGKGEGKVNTSIDLGCRGKSCTNDCSALTDGLFAIIRFLSNGVGLIVVGSLVFAGIQYTTARGDPKASEMAQMRIRSSVVALLIYIFAYAILNYVIPSGFL